MGQEEQQKLKSEKKKQQREGIASQKIAAVRSKEMEEVFPTIDEMEERGQVYMMDRRHYKRKKQRMAGTGLMSLDDMVGRLHLLASGTQGGAISTQATNEMSDIIDKLYNAGVLAQKDVKNLYEKYINY